MNFFPSRLLDIIIFYFYIVRFSQNLVPFFSLDRMGFRQGDLFENQVRLVFDAQIKTELHQIDLIGLFQNFQLLLLLANSPGRLHYVFFRSAPRLFEALSPHYIILKQFDIFFGCFDLFLFGQQCHILRSHL
ncbi:hypothetical protein D1872_283160 [compost metagenome]